jgi:multicomponent Na+:H+ antiporter subunit D
MYFTAAFLTPLLARLKRFSSSTFGIGVSGLGLIIAAVSLYNVATFGPYSYFPGNWTSITGIEIAVDWITIFMHLTINVIGLLIMLYCRQDLIREIKPETEFWYYTVYFLLMAALNALVMSFDLFNIFVFTEIGTITACALVAIKPKRLCIEAALKYLILSTLGSGMILLGISLIYMVTGHLNIGEVAQVLPGAYELYPWNVLAALSLFIIGFGIKSALFPLHVWLPDAHSSAPTPSSALLSGLVIKAYVIVSARIIFQMFGTDLFMRIPIPEVILLFATFGIFAGSLMAISQTDIKRMLAYSSVAQVSYIFLGIALVTSRGIEGGLLHVFNHAVMKSLLFLSAGTVIYKTGIRKIEDLGGVGYVMPITMIAFSVGALSMVGLPGFSGFISKLYLAFGALDAGKPFYVAVILISSLLNGVYYLPIVVKAFFGGHHRQQFVMDQVPIMMLVPIILLAGINIFFGIFPGSLQQLVKLAAAVWLQ